MSEIVEVHVAEIVDSRWQTRQDGYSGPEFDELVASVKEHGVIEPPGVFVNENGEWELIYGHRRLAAARKAGLKVVPVIKNIGPDPDISKLDQELLDRYQQRVLADNLHHQDLTPLEVAQGLKALIEQQGLTQKQLAEIYGKSQQWVSDKLRLLDLAPEVQEQLTARAVEESVARKLAQLPPAYQPAVAKHIEGRPSREATSIIQEIAAATDPAYWDLPDDQPWSPERINVKAMMDGCLELAPPENKGKVLVNLSKSYMLIRPGTASTWSMDRFAKACGQRAESLSTWQAENGRGCETCLFAGEGLWRDCGEPETKTCTHCLIAIDPVRLPYPDAEETCRGCVEHGRWCTDVSCYILALKDVRQRSADAAVEEDLEETVAMLEGLRAFYDRQLQEGVDCQHWLAQGCEACVEFRGPEHKEQCGVEDANYIETAFWQGDGVIVPICSGYRLRDLRTLPEMDQNRFDEILIGWIEASAHKLGCFLAGDDDEGRKAHLHEENLSRKQLVTLLGYAANPYLSTWAKSAEVASPITGEKSKWTVVKEAEEPEETAETELQETAG